MGLFQIGNFKWRVFGRWMAVILSIVVLVWIGFLVYRQSSGSPDDRVAPDDRTSTSYTNLHRQAYLESLSGGNAGSLQDMFLADIKNGVNDERTKSSAYFIVHRYFENGGNIYEIYDYVQSHPELQALKGAELIHPEVFSAIKERVLLNTRSIAGEYAMTAYLEALDRSGYANVAVLGTIAGHEAEAVYYEKRRPEISKTPFFYRSGDEKEKAVRYLRKTEEELNRLLVATGVTVRTLRADKEYLTGKSGVNKEIRAIDFLVGLNQYVAAIRYLEAAGVDVSEFATPQERVNIFAYNAAFAEKFVKELSLFTGMLNASTLLLVSSDDTAGMREALRPIIALGIVREEPSGVTLWIMNARLPSVGALAGYGSEYPEPGIFGKENLSKLGQKVPEFKSWLIQNGWKEEDFK